MLFGGEAATGGVSLLLSVPVGFLLGLATIAIQRRQDDPKATATLKGLVAAILTAIPTPLSSLGLLPMAAFGAIKSMSQKRDQLQPAHTNVTNIPPAN